MNIDDLKEHFGEERVKHGTSMRKCIDSINNSNGSKVTCSVFSDALIPFLLNKGYDIEREINIIISRNLGSSDYGAMFYLNTMSDFDVKILHLHLESLYSKLSLSDMEYL